MSVYMAVHPNNASKVRAIISEWDIENVTILSVTELVREGDIVISNTIEEMITMVKEP